MTSRQPFQKDARFSSDILQISDENERESIRQDLELIAFTYGPQIARETALDYDISNIIHSHLLQILAPNYLWLKLVLAAIHQASGIHVPKKMARFIRDLPKTVNEAYEILLKLSPQLEQICKLLHILVAAFRPLTLREMDTALSIKESQSCHVELQLRPEKGFADYITDIGGPFIRIMNSVYILLTRR